MPRLTGLDGLRALSVIAVLLYHAGRLPAGFLGVEVFFVISGYLITLILVDEWRQRHHIDVYAFWLRRARRLVPASFALIVCVVAVSVLVAPDDVLALRGAALAGLLWASNWYSILIQQSYFEAVGRPPLLRHLWSVAIEAQFYVIWPFVLLVGLRAWRGRLALAIPMAGAIGSTVLMAFLFHDDVDPSRVYYGTDTRVSGLLVGAGLALLPATRLARLPAAACDSMCLVALIGLAYVCARLTELDSILYRGGLLVVDGLSATAIAASVHPNARLCRAVLDAQPLRWIGIRSYGIYLWHWPIFMLTRPQLDVRLDGWPLLVLRVFVVAVAAEISFRFVEMPLRRGGMRWIRVAGGAAVGAVVLGTSIAAAKPPERPAYLPVDSLDTWSAAAIPAGPVAAPAIEPAPELPDEPVQSADTTLVSVAAMPVQAPMRVTAIGDSVMLGAVAALEADIDGIEIDASISRQTSVAIELLRARAAAGQLGDVVVVHLGNNGTFSASQFDTMMDVLASVPRVVFVNVKVPRAWEEPNDAVLANGVQRYANAVLVDWRATSVDRPEFFWDDGIHLRPEGAAAYAALIASKLTVEG
jgi:peptidoglycan/LPS O-acetylase OafA/YrhL